MSTPRSLLYAATYADPELPRVINAYRAEMAEAELRAARAVAEWVIDQYQFNKEIQIIAVDDARLRAIIEKAWGEDG